MVTLLAMQVGVLLLALAMFVLTYLVSRSLLREAAEDWKRIGVLLGKGERK
ncbi:hypothetical protein [Pseudomonas cavernae]|uniref:hypothetical protein n=1 Tax=Pseudomonas cavernae TaxID=2320867 RepID=UPI0013C4D3EC|nr:hypothetical protein [Pseudomonas cavernae]